MLKNTKPPITKTKEFSEKIHNAMINDPYRWLEDGENKEVGKWIDSQNRLSDSFLRKLPARQKIAERFRKLWKINTIGIPSPKKGYYFITERKANQELSVLYVQKGLYGKKRVLIDQNKLSKDKTATMSFFRSSQDGKLAAYGISKKSNDQFAIYVLDVESGKKLKDVIPAEVYPGSIAWNPDGTGFWYSRRKGNAKKGEEKLNKKVYYHKLGDSFKKDKFIFGEQINKYALPTASISIDGRYLRISVSISTGNILRNDLYLKDLTKKNSDFVPVIKNINAIFLSWMHRDNLFIQTNYEAPNWKIITTPLASAAKGIKSWRTVIPEGKNVITDVITIKDRIFVERLENVHSSLVVYNLAGKFISDIKLPTIGTIQGVRGEPEGDEAFFGFVSFLVPMHVYRFDLKTNKLKLFNKLKIGVDFKDFIVKQVWASSKDKTKIPMFLIHKKGLKRDGKNPTIIYGYGGFNISSQPGFNSTRIPFLEHGGVYAIANIRGGGEFGERWHLAGTRAKKQNVFDDFIAASEWLIKNKYTNSNRLAAFGWSNGGLLMGAMITQRPDLFKAIVAGAPVMDMLRFHKFHGGFHWIADYGDPDDSKMFRHLLKYSPYHNIKTGVRYPATLVLTAEGDDRVHPMHAYKFVARLQKANGSQSPILLRVERKAGHGGAASVSNTIRQYVDIYAFLFWQLGMK